MLDRRAVEELPEVLNNLVVELEYIGRESYLPSFMVLRPGDDLINKATRDHPGIAALRSQ